jgi:hypothetical protein
VVCFVAQWAAVTLWVPPAQLSAVWIPGGLMLAVALLTEPRRWPAMSSLTERLFFSNRWSAGFVVGYDRDDELDLAGRSRVVGFGARMLAQSNHIELRATGGVVLTRERYFSTDSTAGSGPPCSWTKTARHECRHQLR